jgi:protein-S-isoprenylcysteine O-methyltransferase Ste14
VTLLSLVAVSLHAWAGRGHFASTTMPRGAVGLVVAVTVASLANIVLTWWQPLWPPAAIVGLVLEALSLWLFGAAIRASREARLLLAFDQKLPHSIVRQGPYRWVRHPFYTSYLIFWIGWAIAIWSPWALLPLTLTSVIYVIAALGEERKFARTPLAADYAAYRREAGMFWPVLGQTKGRRSAP